MPPLRLSTFDPFGSSNQLGPSTPTDERKSHSPRLEARGSEPVPPPPPPRWCKPQLAAPSTEDSSEPESPVTQVPEEDSVVVVERPVVVDQPPTPVRKEVRRPVQRRRKPRRRRSTAPLSPHCHHSSLADKASDYEDIWGTSPGASHDEDEDDDIDPRPVVLLANEEDTALSDRPEEEEEEEEIREDDSISKSSSNSTLEKMTSASSDRPDEIPASRSISSSPEPAILDETEEIRPPSPFQQTEEEEEKPQRLSVTIIEIRNSPTMEMQEVDNKENVPDIVEVPVRRRASCSSTESRGEANSRRTSPLYSEPADALPPQLAWKNSSQQGRPLPLPPGSNDFTTFTKDGYVRCTLPTQNQSNAPRVNVLPPTGQRNNRGKQIVMPKPPRPPANTVTAAVEQRKAFPSTIYLPAPGDDSITIQVGTLVVAEFM